MARADALVQSYCFGTNIRRLPNLPMKMPQGTCPLGPKGQLVAHPVNLVIAQKTLNIVQLAIVIP